MSNTETAPARSATWLFPVASLLLLGAVVAVMRLRLCLIIEHLGYPVIAKPSQILYAHSLAII